MNTYQFEINATVADEALVVDAAVHLGAALAKAGDMKFSAVEQTEALGMTSREIVLNIVISFTTSMAATEAIDLIKSMLKNVHTSAVVHVDVSYDSNAEPKEKGGASSAHSRGHHPTHRTDESH